MKTLRLQLRFLIPLLLTLVAAAYFALPLMDKLTLRWFARDLNTSGEMLASTLTEPLAESVLQDNKRRLQTLLDRAAQDERMVAIGLCAPDGTWLNRTNAFPKLLTCAGAARAAEQPQPRLRIEGGPVLVGVHPVMTESGKVADLVLLDASPLDDIANVSRISAVCAHGALLGRATLDKLLGDVQAQ
ncbi:MAG TPA: hypothetical protein VJ608_07355, partial [Albitalea sp.]|nr:hypothetical protein [Albitalea sp.]